MTTTETNILADHTVVRRLGNWTRHSALQVRARLRLHGNARDSQVRIQRAGVAELTGMLPLSRKDTHRARQAIAGER